MNINRSAKTARPAKIFYGSKISDSLSMANQSYTMFLKFKYLNIISTISMGSLVSGSMAVEGERRSWRSLS